MNQRQKELRRRQRVKEVRRKLFVLCVLSVICASAVIALAADQYKESKQTIAKKPEKQPAKGETKRAEENNTDTGTRKMEEQTKPEPVTITISAAGDCTLGTDENFDPGTNFVSKYNEVSDPGYFLSNVKDIFSSDDLTIVNLEGTLSSAGERADKKFAFRGDPSYTEILTRGSVEAVNLANNHSKDYGEQSFQDTITNVEAAGITTFGYERTAIVEKKGVKIGLLGTYVLKDGIGCKQGMLDNINSLKQQGAQLIIASFHWGIEREYEPEAVQKELAHAAIDAGAHLVLGHHPHVLQGVEEYNGRYICYSLGNFCFGGNKNPSDKDTMIYRQTFTITGDEVAADDNKEIIPCSLSSATSINNYQPTPAEGTEKERIMNKIHDLAT